MTTLHVRQSPGCLRCETLPSPLIGPGTLHFRFPLSHSRAKILRWLQEGEAIWRESEDLVSVQIAESDLTARVQSLTAALTVTEQADVRVLFEPDSQPLKLRDYFNVESLQQFAAKTQSGWLLDLLENDRLTTVFQPIVECSTREIFAYECLMRGMEGERLIPPMKMLEVARGAGLLFQLDRMARLTSIRQAHRWGIESKIFINFTPTAIYDPINCLRSTIEAVDSLGIEHERIVFEVIESESVNEVGHLNRILDFYREAGFLVALDDLGSGYSSLNLLSQLRPDFVKLDRDLISGITGDQFKAMLAAKLIEAANGLGLQTVAEGVETAEEWDWLCAHGATFAQGYYLAKPAAPPPLLNSLAV